jgi:hypothetical protein
VAAFQNLTSRVRVDFWADSELVRLASKAFAGTGITGDLSLPASLHQFELQVFEDCKWLRSFNLPSHSKLENLCRGAFQRSGVVSLGVPGVRNLEDEVFSGCQSLRSGKFSIPGQTRAQGRSERGCRRTSLKVSTFMSFAQRGHSRGSD